MSKNKKKLINEAEPKLRKLNINVNDDESKIEEEKKKFSELYSSVSVVPSSNTYVPQTPVHANQNHIHNTEIVDHNRLQNYINPYFTTTLKQPELTQIPKFDYAKKILQEVYNDEDVITSTSLDILALYLKGQKILYIESKTFCEKKLNSFMLPAIFISAMCAILNFALSSVSFGNIIISSLNTFNAFLLSLINFLKLDAKAEAHKTTAYKYQKLESYCEFKSGKILFFKENKDISKLSEILAEIETKVLEIKESNQFIIPEYVRNRYPNIYSTNVFTLVKEIQNQEIILINDFKNALRKVYEVNNEIKINDYEITLCNEQINFINNQLLYIDSINKKIDILESKNVEKDENVGKEIFINKTILTNYKTKSELENEKGNLLPVLKNLETKKAELLETFKILEKLKDDNLQKAVNFRDKYLSIDKIFKDEIELNIERENTSCKDCCDWFKS